MKRLFLLRHGQAEMHASSDSQRNLTDRGRLEVNSTIEQAAMSLPHIDEVWVSPYLRAQQTWSQARDVLARERSNGLPLRVVNQPDITPAGSVRVIMGLLEEAFNKSSLNSIVLVTHQPFVGELLEQLCDLEAGRYFLGTAHMAAIDIPVIDSHLAIVAPGMGTLQWLKHPLI